MLKKDTWIKGKAIMWSEHGFWVLRRPWGELMLPLTNLKSLLLRKDEAEAWDQELGFIERRGSPLVQELN